MKLSRIQIVASIVGLMLFATGSAFALNQFDNKQATQQSVEETRSSTPPASLQTANPQQAGTNEVQPVDSTPNTDITTSPGCDVAQTELGDDMDEASETSGTSVSVSCETTTDSSSNDININSSSSQSVQSSSGNASSSNSTTIDVDIN